MKSLFKLSLFTFMVIMTTFVAYNKSDSGLQPETAVKPAPTLQALAASPTQIFRLDGKDVKAGTFAVDDPNRFIVLEQLDNNVLVINGFTSQEAYFQFGDNGGWNFRMIQKIEDHLSAYAESSGAIAEQEKTGAIPKWWDPYVDNYLSTLVRSSATPRSVSTDLYQDFNSQGRNTTLVKGFRGTSAVLWLWGMSDNISSFHPAQLMGSAQIAYDKSWFRKRMFIWVGRQVGPAAFNVNLDGNLAVFDDQASSWVQI